MSRPPGHDFDYVREPRVWRSNFHPFSAHKLSDARRLIDESGLDIRLEVDGGIKISNIRQVADAGADTFVAGSAIFGSEDYAQTIAEMRAELA